MMKIKKLPGGVYNEIPQRNFKFITLGKLELYSPKQQTTKNMINKVDNKYKFPPINNNNSHLMRKANNTSKVDDFNVSM